MSAAAFRSLVCLLWLPLAGSCAAQPAPLETPDQLVAGRPIGRADNLRAGDFSWRLGSIAPTEDGWRIDFTLLNGTSRGFRQTLLRITVRSEGSDFASIRYPTGPIHGGQSRTYSAHFPELDFVPVDAGLSLLSAQND